MLFAITVLSLKILVASDFDKVAGTAIFYLQIIICNFLRIIWKVAGGSRGSYWRYRGSPTPVVNSV